MIHDRSWFCKAADGSSGCLLKLTFSRLSAFARKLQKMRPLASSCLSIRPHVTTQPVTRFSWYLVLGSFAKVCLHTQILVKSSCCSINLLICHSYQQHLKLRKYYAVTMFQSCRVKCMCAAQNTSAGRRLQTLGCVVSLWVAFTVKAVTLTRMWCNLHETRTPIDIFMSRCL
jgi:hypothetical protein